EDQFSGVNSRTAIHPPFALLASEPGLPRQLHWLGPLQPRNLLTESVTRYRSFNRRLRPWTIGPSRRAAHGGRADVFERRSRASTRSAAHAVALAILLLCLRSAVALDPSLDVSQYAHTAWRIRDGFTRGMINAIAQTPDGYLWLGTEFGLVRFDDVRAVPWQPKEGLLPSSYAGALLVARDGTLWI